MFIICWLLWGNLGYVWNMTVKRNEPLWKVAVVGFQWVLSKGEGQEIELFLGNAGTAMRPLTAAVTAASGNSSYTLDGVPRMRERPMGHLVTGLKQLRADAECTLGLLAQIVPLFI